MKYKEIINLLVLGNDQYPHWKKLHLYSEKFANNFISLYMTIHFDKDDWQQNYFIIKVGNWNIGLEFAFFG